MLLNVRINSNRHQRRIQRKRRKIITRIYEIRARANNANALLGQIAQMPLQITNDSFANQIFNGAPF